MIVSKDKKYRTRDGREVVIYQVYPDSCEGEFKVHGAAKLQDKNHWLLYSWTMSGRYSTNKNIESNNDLVEVSPYDGFKTDDPIVVWMDIHPEIKYNRHFAGVTEDGKVLAYVDGLTSWSVLSQGQYSARIRSWDHGVKPPHNI